MPIRLALTPTPEVVPTSATDKKSRPHTGAFIRYASVPPRSDYIGAVRP
jgi:hypothetical protein